MRLPSARIARGRHRHPRAALLPARVVTLATLALLAVTVLSLAAPAQSQRKARGGGSGGSSGDSGAPNPMFQRFRSQQAFFCSRIFPTVRDYPPAFAVVANMNASSVNASTSFPPFQLYVYKDHDIVSEYIQLHGTWELPQVHSALALLEEYRVAHHLRKEDITFLDIGSNVGVFAMTMAMAGYKVIAFEPMQRNEMMLRSSICANNLMDRITYINLGLSSKRQLCRMISSKTNSGNGVVFCDDQAVPPGFEIRSTIQIARIDAVIPPHIARQLRIPVFKMDTEGLEALVMQGGRSFFSKPEMRYGFLEYNTETQNHTEALTQELQQQGFKVSAKGIKGPQYDVSNDTAFYGRTVRDVYAWRT